MVTVILGSGHWEGDLPDTSHPKSFQEQQLRKSLELCSFVLDSIDGEAISQDELHRVQRALYLRSTIYHALHDNREWEDLFRAIELALNSDDPFRTPPFTTEDLILAVHFIGALACVDQVQAPTRRLVDTIKVTDELRRKITPGFDVFQFVKANSDRLLRAVGKSPPILLLLPAEALYLPSAVWAPTHILSLPGWVSRSSNSGSLRDDTSAITGRLLSTLATRIAEVTHEINDDVGPDASEIGPFSKFFRFQPGTPIVLLLRYIALGLAPSAQRFQALGDLISSIGGNVTRVMTGGAGTGPEMKLDVAGVAVLYYEFGMKTLC
jgi:hypothetical protein